MTARCTLATLLLLSLPGLTRQAQAQALNENTVTVVAVGKVSIRPDTLVVNGVISESNEKMKDAVTAFKDTRRRALASMQALEIENLDLTASGLKIDTGGGDSPYQELEFERGGKKKSKDTLTISQSVTLKITGLGELDDQRMLDLAVQVLGAAKEAGVNLGPTNPMLYYDYDYEAPTAATFRISDPLAAQKQATIKAMENAKADATQLAQLAGGKLGPVVAIAETGQSEMLSSMHTDEAMWDEEAQGFSRNAFKPIPVARSLVVSYRLITE